MDARRINETIGKNIRHHRRLHGLSQSALADRLGITFQQVQKYESGSNAVSPARLLQLCAVFDCTVEELVSAELLPTRSHAIIPAPCKAVDLLYHFRRITSDEVQNHICQLVRAVAEQKGW